MANRVTMNICGEEYTLVAEESAAYMQKVGSLVDAKMTEVMTGTHVGRTDAAVLAALNIADELMRAHDENSRLRREIMVLRQER